jgi:hypothetical protein
MMQGTPLEKDAPNIQKSRMLQRTDGFRNGSWLCENETARVKSRSASHYSGLPLLRPVLLGKRTPPSKWSGRLRFGLPYLGLQKRHNG